MTISCQGRMDALAPGTAWWIKSFRQRCVKSPDGENHGQLEIGPALVDQLLGILCCSCAKILDAPEEEGLNRHTSKKNRTPLGALQSVRMQEEKQG